MQFAVPQFTDVEDKLIGPLTLKQFLMLLGVAGILFFFWSIFGLSAIFYIIAFPLGAAGLYVTFRKFNGRPFFFYLIPFISYLISPKAMVFMREPDTMSFSSKTMAKPPAPATLQSEAAEESAESRLKKLAYLLDKKMEQESDLIKESAVNSGSRPEIDLIPKPASVKSQSPKKNLLNPIIQHVAGTAVSAEKVAPSPRASAPATQPAAPKTGDRFNPSNMINNILRK